MDLSSPKVTNEEKLNLCSKYFKIGFAFLPFVWAINAVWFFNDGFRKAEFEGQKLIKKYVVLSAIGSTLWTIGFISWIVIFYFKRVEWGATADYLSFNIMIGKP
jgi:presenilin enhancer 2